MTLPFPNATFLLYCASAICGLDYLQK